MADRKKIHVLYSRIPADFSEDVLTKHLDLLPAKLREKHFRYRRWQDRAASLLSKVLLLRALNDFGEHYRALSAVQYTEFARPFIPGPVDFNISHSGEFILCAVGKDVRIGVDIEQIKDVDFSDFEGLMTAEQWQQIHTADNPTTKFFEFWAIKESIIKADGRGLSVPLNDIVLTKDTGHYENSWYLHRLNIHHQYSSFLATSSEAAELVVEGIDVYSL